MREVDSFSVALQNYNLRRALGFMNSAEYKQEKNKWNVKSRNIIADSMVLIEGENKELCAKLEKSLACPPIEKPPSHTGGIESDLFEVLLTMAEIQELIELLFDLEAAAALQGEGLGFEQEALQARKACNIASLLDEWNKLNVI